MPFFTKFFNKYSLKYVSWFYNHCNLVSAPSKSVIDEMLKFGLKQKSIVISNPIFNTHKKNHINKIKNKYGLSKNTIVFASRLAKEKKIDVIIKALPIIKKQIPDIIFAIA